MINQTEVSNFIHASRYAHNSSTRHVTLLACITQHVHDVPPGVKLPIVAAPMAGASGGLLAAQVSAAGAFGFLAAGTFDRISQIHG